MSFAQKEETKEIIPILEADTAIWGREDFKFPLGFAREIDYKGIEEAYFPKGWKLPEQDDFWSYAFVWEIDKEEILTEKELERDIKRYFDGLMDMNRNGTKETGILSSTTLFIEKGKFSDVSFYLGKVKTFDRFTTKKTMTLNVSVEQSYCEDTEKTIVFFRFSPKAFDHPIWKKLNTLKLSATVCKD
jgi:hypothetical protein